MPRMTENGGKKGFFITFEGPEGSGKSTQIRLLATHLRDKGLPVITSREPGGTDIGDLLRDIVHDKRHQNMAPTTEALLYQASRAQLVAELIRPALEDGSVVLLDRFTDSSTAYQGGGRDFGPETIDYLNNFSTGRLTPNLTFLIDIEIESGLERRGKTDEVNRMDLQSLEFHQTVRNSYLRMVKEDVNDRWVVVDGSRNIEAVHHDILQTAEARLVARGLSEGNRPYGPERF